MDTKFADRAEDFFAELDTPILDVEQSRFHAVDFMFNHFDRSKLGSAYGYNTDEAFRFQLLSYAEEVFGLEDPRK